MARSARYNHPEGAEIEQEARDLLHRRSPDKLAQSPAGDGAVQDIPSIGRVEIDACLSSDILGGDPALAIAHEHGHGGGPTRRRVRLWDQGHVVVDALVDQVRGHHPIQCGERPASNYTIRVTMRIQQAGPALELAYALRRFR